MTTSSNYKTKHTRGTAEPNAALRIHTPEQAAPRLPRAQAGEALDVIAYVVTGAGWVTFQDLVAPEEGELGNVRVLTRLIYEAARERVEESGGAAEWRSLPGNHAKAVLYHDQQLAVVSSMNLTQPSLRSNTEFVVTFRGDGYERLCEFFERTWREASTSEQAVVVPGSVRPGDVPDVVRRELLPDDEELDLGAPPPELIYEPIEHLLPFQDELVGEIGKWIDHAEPGGRGRIIHLPTGAGKTLVAASVIDRFLRDNPDSRVLWCCHRLEPLVQAFARVRVQVSRPTSLFIPPHVLGLQTSTSKEAFYQSNAAQIVFCTHGSIGNLPWSRQFSFDLVVVDECHRYHPDSKLYRRLEQGVLTEDAWRLGLTYTPLTAEEKDFGRYWQTDPHTFFTGGVTRDSLEEEGVLSRTPPHPPVDTGLRFSLNSRRDFDIQVAERVTEFDNPSLAKATVDQYDSLREDHRRILVFGVGIDHVDYLLEAFQKRFGSDVPARAVHSKMPYPQIRSALSWFRSDAEECRLLLSVLMLTEGADLPGVDCMFMLRPTFSSVLYRQMLGRGLRGPKVGGTPTCTVVDFTYQFIDEKNHVLHQIQRPGLDSAPPEMKDGPNEELAYEPAKADQPRPFTVPHVGSTLNRLVDRLENEEGWTRKRIARRLEVAESTLRGYFYGGKLPRTFQRRLREFVHELKSRS